MVDSLAQRNLDNIGGITDRLPLVMVAIAAVTFVLIFLMTGSVILPLKALVMNLLSLCVAFGALVWIFQDGHLGGLGTVATGHARPGGGAGCRRGSGRVLGSPTAGSGVYAADGSIELVGSGPSCAVAPALGSGRGTADSCRTRHGRGART
ncbi:MmpL family protein [Mycobacteroides abscessus subsp. abscessus]|nr:MmpL family protein [Mycobacteroides abscessus subsp. abscessus]